LVKKVQKNKFDLAVFKAGKINSLISKTTSWQQCLKNVS